MCKRILIVLILCLSFFVSDSVLAGELTGWDIMKKVDDRDDGETTKSRLKIVLINKAKDQRIRSMLSYRKDYGKDSKSIMICEEPLDVKGTGYLSWEYDDVNKDDSRWLYMPALRKIRRISGSSDDDYFMGTDFTYDDMEKRNIEEDSHTLLREEEVEGKKCWVVKSIPKDKDSEYKEKILWIRKDNYMAIKIEFFNEYGLLKIFKAKNIEQIDGIWTAKKLIMENKQKDHKTILEFFDIEYNVSLSDKLFKAANLKRGNLGK